MEEESINREFHNRSTFTWHHLMVDNVHGVIYSKWLMTFSSTEDKAIIAGCSRFIFHCLGYEGFAVAPTPSGQQRRVHQVEQGHPEHAAHLR